MKRFFASCIGFVGLVLTGIGIWSLWESKCQSGIGAVLVGVLLIFFVIIGFPDKEKSLT